MDSKRISETCVEINLNSQEIQKVIIDPLKMYLQQRNVNLCDEVNLEIHIDKYGVYQNMCKAYIYDYRVLKEQIKI